MTAKSAIGPKGLNAIRLSRDRARDLTEQYILSRAPGTMLLLVLLALYLAAQHKRRARERRRRRYAHMIGVRIQYCTLGNTANWIKS